MTDECQHIAKLLGLGEDLPEALGPHMDNCLSCKGLTAVYADLDGLLLSDPVPLAPLDFAQAVMAAIAALDPRAELRTARLQSLIALAAAIIIAAVATWGLPVEGESTLWVPDHEAALVHSQGVVQSIATQLEQGLDALLAVLPSPPLMLLWLVAPLLLGLNWLLSRQHLSNGMTT